MKTKQEEARKIVEAFYDVLSIRRSLGMREHEFFRRELFLQLPKEWRSEIIKETAEVIFEREKEMRCLACGKDISKKIIDREIRLHFCKDCRKNIIDKIIEGGW
jgi:hypothetical protein